LGISPSRWYYGVSILVLIVGFSIFGWWLFSSISTMAGGLIQVAAPGTADLNLQEAGEYTIFYENQSFVNGSFYSTRDNIAGLQIEIIEKSSGIRLPAYSPPGRFTYCFGSRSGQSILAFQISHPGSYQLNAFYLPDYQGPKVVLAIGHNLTERIVATVINSLVVFFGSMILSAALAVIIYRKRQKILDRQREEERLLRGGKSSRS
jgi:ABC-type transport system involved in multi-copper enzyme maturation permease subunit